MDPTSNTNLMRRTCWHGLTLIEALVAIVIIGIALLPLVHAQRASIRAADRARDLRYCQFLAADLIEQTIIEKSIPPETAKGRFLDHPNYSWEMKALPFEGDKRFQDGVRIVATVRQAGSDTSQPPLIVLERVVFP